MSKTPKTMCAHGLKEGRVSHVQDLDLSSPSLIATFFQLLFQAAIKNLRVRNKNKCAKLRVHPYKRTCSSRRARCHNRDIWPGKPGRP